MPPEPGVSAALARERSARISNLRVALHLSLSDDRTAPLPGTVVMAFDLADAGSPLVLDFAPNEPGRLGECDANGVAVEAGHALEHVIIPASALHEGRNSIRLQFVAGDEPLNRRDDHLYTIFVPARAREAFPCLDQPDLKARWTLTLELPDHWVAVSNAAALTPVSSAPGRVTMSFAETEPLPTYLFAFAAGAFVESVDDRDGRELRVYHTASDTILFETNRTAILDGHAAALHWLERYTGLAYPFGKFDIVLLPAFQFGGMEHPGAIFYNATVLLLTAAATRQQEFSRAHVIAHETAHMWFGDLVTMTWFDDVWMKEVFANFMAARIVNPLFDDLDHDLAFFLAHYPAAYDVDRTAGAHPIRQALGNLNDAGSLYGAIIYLKSPIVMRQLELLLGDAALQRALREYLSTFRFANASWPDLLEILSRHTASDLRAWSHQWIETAGRPAIRTQVAIEGGVVTSIVLRTDEGARSPGKPGVRSAWPQRLEVGVGRGGSVTHLPVWMDGEVEIPGLAGQAAPDFILANGRGLGYGDLHLDARSRQWLLAHLPEVPDALTRASSWQTLWDEMLRDDVPPEVLLDLAVQCVSTTGELSLQRMLHDVERLFWIFLSPAQRDARAPALESALSDALGSAATVSARAVLFGCLRGIATRAATVDWLRALWNGETTLPGLPLGDAEYVVLAQELAVRSEDGDDLVRRQLARLPASYRRDALAFVAPALSRDRATRDRFFATVSDRRNRRREPWVIDGLRWLHHPLRAEGAVHLVGPGLHLLEEVSRTGDIFLPKRWLDAMLGGHGSRGAAAVVRTFLETRQPDYPAALGRMILASADLLFRAAARARA
ncbi:MAG TPA: M1 family aminopeptidase [Vicinamibacterales bacterium]|nr:M1 family aminopeptidase [Vicinamibacterales bacterium]